MGSPEETPSGSPESPGGRIGQPQSFVDSERRVLRGSGAAPSGSLAAPALTDGELGPLAGDLAPGTILGKYQIVQRLGVGGMGSVYEAVHTGIAKAVALKTMSPALAADPRASARFMREAAAASRLDHPHVVGVTDFGTDRGLSYLVMELLRGEDLGAVIAREPGTVDPGFLADMMLAVCAGVFAAHESGVVHRDLKPQNIFLSRTSLGETVAKVLDFGISKMIEDDVNAPLTNTGMVMGTTHYLSPEQVQGKGVDARSDQYSLGVILYETLTGRRPHVGNSVYEIMRSISDGTFAPPRSLRPNLSSAFEAVVLRAMATRPQDRFESVYGLGRALLQLASPKRRVIWADYYDRDRAGKPAGSIDVRSLSARAAEDSGGTRVMSVKPAQLSVTRTQFAPPELREPPKAEGRARAQETRLGERVMPRTGRPARPRAVRRLAVVAAIGLCGLGAFLLWRSPELRAQLPESMRATLDRGIAAVRRTQSKSPPPATERAIRAPSSAKTTPSPEGAMIPAQAADNSDPGSPFSPPTVAPFDPPRVKGPEPAAKAAIATDGGVAGTDAGARATATGAAPSDDDAKAVRSKRRRPTPSNTDPSAAPTTPQRPLPPSNEAIPTPDQIPARRYFSPNAPPILE